MSNPRAFIDMNGGYQSERSGADKEAHDAWVESNTWGLTRDDFIRLSYFHGDLESGSDGMGPINGSEDRPGDVVYIHPEKGALTRSMVSYWFADSNSFMHGYKKAVAARATPPAMPSPPSGVSADNSEVPYLIMFDDQDRENELIIGDWRAAIRFKQISAAWNGRLFVQIAVNSRDDKSPCYAAPVAPSGAQEPVGYADPVAFLNFKIEREQSRGGPYSKEWMWAKPDVGLVPLYTANPPAIGGPVQDERELIAAAEAVIVRWYTPKWKDEQHTAVFIERLRTALAAIDVLPAR